MKFWEITKLFFNPLFFQICLVLSNKKVILRYMAKYRSVNIDNVVAVTKALSDRNRLRVVLMLGSGELCLCQIIEMLSLAPSTVSKHMTVLRQAGLVEARKQGRWIYYKLSQSDNDENLQGIVTWAREALSGDRQTLDDARQLEIVKQMDNESLCQHYKKTKTDI